MEGWTKWLFWIGVLIALIVGLIPVFAPTSAGIVEWLILIQVILGILIGVMNVEVKETAAFFLSGIAFLVAYPAFTAFTANLTQLAGLWTFINAFLAGMAALVAPAILCVAIKVLPAIMKD